MIARRTWRDLPQREQLLLRGTLRDLYGFRGADREVFDLLDLDKQQALLLLARRFARLQLWQHVRRVTNVYGTSGVGCEFVADPRLANVLDARRDFTSRFARHTRAVAGYLERCRPRAALHLLLMNREDRRWSAHFDAHSPVVSPLTALRHLWHERLRGERPAWHDIESLARAPVSARTQK